MGKKFLSSDLKQVFYKLNLPLNIALVNPLDLPIPDHVHHLNRRVIQAQSPRLLHLF